MPRVRQQKKSSRGTRICGNVACGREIKPGETYYWWKFRQGGRNVRCADHPPKPSELTQSKMSAVYDAIEGAEKGVAEANTIEDVKSALEQVAEEARTVVDEYREAAEAFGGAGPNGEKADELEGWVDDLESFDPEEPNEYEFAFDEEIEGPRLSQEMFGIDVPTELPMGELTDWAAALQAKREEWDTKHEAEIEAAEKAAVETAKEEATDLMGSCPL